MPRNRVSLTDISRGLVHMEGISHAQADRITRHILEQISNSLVRGDTVYLPRFGKLSAIYKEERNGIHPRNLTPMVIPATVRVKFEASSSLKRLLNQSIETFKWLASPAPSTPLDSVGAVSNEEPE